MENAQGGIIVPESWYVDGGAAEGRTLHVSVAAFEDVTQDGEAWIVLLSAFRLEIGLRCGARHHMIRIPQPGVMAAMQLQESLSRRGQFELNVSSLLHGSESGFVVSNVAQRNREGRRHEA